jgi:hypothetical protein
MAEEEPKAKEFVRQILKDSNDNHKYLFITTKAIKEEYLDAFLKEEYPDLHHVIMYYGNLKGINDAMDSSDLPHFVGPSSMKVSLSSF